MTKSDAEGPGSKPLEIMHGGPFFNWQMAVGLLTPARFRSTLRCGTILVLTWVMPILMLSLSDGSQLSAFLADPTAWAKFAIAAALFIAAEPWIERALDDCTRLFFDVPLLADPASKPAEKALSDAKTRCGSVMAEAVCALFALAITCSNIWMLTDNAHWALNKGALTVSGWFCLLVSGTMVWFLLLRLVWRHIVWAMFLGAISRTDLRLVASHPDGHAGLGFLSAYANGYILFNLGAGSIVAAGLARELHRGTLSMTTFSAICALWLAMVAVYFMLPLAGFIGQIMRLKVLTIALTLGPMMQAERDEERSKLGRNAFPEPPVPERPQAPEAVPIYRAAVKCSPLLLSKSNIVSIFVAALLPLAVVGLSAFSYSDLVPVLKRLLFL